MYNKYNPLFNPIRTKFIEKEDKIILGTFDYETINFNIDKNIINKLEHKEIIPIIISYSLWIDNKGIFTDLICEDVIEFYENINFDKDELNANHNKQIGKWIDKLFGIIVENNCKRIIIWAHNFSGFDGWIFINSFNELYKKIYKIEIIKKESKIYCVTIRKGKFQIKFVCRILLLNFSLKKLRESFKIERIKIFFPHDLIDNKEVYQISLDNLILLINRINYTQIEKDIFIDKWNEHKCENIFDYIKIYCKIDTKALKDIIIKFFAIYIDIFNIRISYRYFITASRLRLITFLHPLNKFYDKNIKSIPNKNPVDVIIRQSYTGGRCEVFKAKNKKGKIYYYDFPGIYRIAIKIKLPIGEPTHFVFDSKNLRKDEIKSIINYIFDSEYLAFIRVETYIEDNKTYIPLLPIKKVNDNNTNKLIFCFGNNNNVYFSEELKIFVENGGVIKSIHEIIVFKSGYPLKKYSEFNLEFKNKSKESGDKVKETLFKLLNNSIYGKFAITEPNSKFILETEIVKLNKNTILSTIPLTDDLCLVEVLNDKGDNWVNNHKVKINVAIGAAISSYGRIILSRSILKVKEQNPEADLLYCDTDRIFWDREIDINCENIYVNGDIKISWETQELYNDCLFLRRKIYWLEKSDGTVIIKRKGVKSKNITKEQIDSLIRGETEIITHNNLQWVKINTRIPLTRLLSKKFIPFENSKRKLIYDQNNIWTGDTVAFVNNIKTINYNTTLVKNHSWIMPYNLSYSKIEDSTLLKFSKILDEMFDNTYGIITDLPHFNIIFDYLKLNKIKRMRIDIHLFNFDYYLKDDEIDSAEVFYDIYWFIIHCYKSKNLRIYNSVGIIASRNLKNITLSPSYVDFIKLKIIGPDYFTKTLCDKIDYYGEMYIDEGVGFSNIFLDKRNFEIIIRFLKT